MKIEGVRYYGVGDGHFLSEVVDKSGAVCGYLDDHDNAREPGKKCGGSVPLENSSWAQPNRSWTATGSLEGGDLTLSPSLLCTACGDHGWVRNGKWERA